MVTIVFRLKGGERTQPSRDGTYEPRFYLFTDEEDGVGVPRRLVLGGIGVPLRPRPLWLHHRSGHGRDDLEAPSPPESVKF